MENGDLIAIWKEGNREMLKTHRFERSELEAFLKPRMSKAARGLHLNVLVYIVVQIAAMVLIGLNLHGYRSNPIMLSVLGVLFVLSVLFMAYGVFLLTRIYDTSCYASDFVDTIKKRLSLYRLHYEAWMWMMALSAAILVFVLGAWMDNDRGAYRINHPVVFVVVNLLMVLFIYGTQKLAQLWAVRQMKAYLNDLERDVLEGTHQLEDARKWRLLFVAIVFVVLTALLVWGIIRYAQFTP
jgi:MFS family permease